MRPHSTHCVFRRCAVAERVSFPEAEEATLKWWEENDTFRESVRRSEGKKPYVFYDGPPFATGLPHYGHLLAGTIKVSASAAGRERASALRARARGLTPSPWALPLLLPLLHLAQLAIRALVRGSSLICLLSILRQQRAP